MIFGSDIAMVVKGPDPRIGRSPRDSDGSKFCDM